MQCLESRIIYENGDFYAFQTSTCEFEIRKNKGTHAVVIGHVSDAEIAKRFIDRAAKYPNNF